MTDQQTWEALLDSASHSATNIRKTAREGNR